MKETEVSNFEGSCVRSQMIFVDGRPQEILVRQGNTQSKVFIDQLTFVFSVESFIENCLGIDSKELSSRDIAIYNFIVHQIFTYLKAIFGFSSYQKRDRGLNRYQHSYSIGASDNELVNYGTICIGGNNDTCCIVITGMGCNVANNDWELRLHNFAQQLGSSFRISRIDVTRDFFQGEYTVDDAERDYLEGGYTLSKVTPICDKQGADWFNNNTNSGRTFYIGSRKNSSRLVRVYEKGKQLGDPDSCWVRLEVCYRRRDLVLPIDMLINPTAYVSEYLAIRKALFSLSDKPKSIDVKSKKLQLSFERAKIIYARQSGRWINFLIKLGRTSDEIIKELTKHLKPDQIPKRFDPRCYLLCPT